MNFKLKHSWDKNLDELRDFLCLTSNNNRWKISNNCCTPPGNVTVNHVQIVESEVFVYNLGTMYYIDDLLYPEVLDKITKASDLPTTTNIPTTFKLTTSPDADIEPVPAAVTQSAEQGKDIFVLNERGGNIDESSDFDHDLDDADDEEDDDEIVTPRALPVQFMIEPPKK